MTSHEKERATTLIREAMLLLSHAITMLALDTPEYCDVSGAKLGKTTKKEKT